MKFAIRDDDLNFFFNPLEIEKNYNRIWDICPISMSVVPFIKGDWKSQIQEFEELGPGLLSESILKKTKDDNTIYPIGDNGDLVKFIKKKIKENRIYLTIHGIHHRNEDPIIPELKSNYGICAEFFTSRDLQRPLRDAVIYLENLFNQSINVFTPPQNLLSVKGFKAVSENKLFVCGNFPNVKKFSTLKLFGLRNCIKRILMKILFRYQIFPFGLSHKNLNFVGHHSLQPGTNIEELYLAFEKASKIPESVFVVSTHSYGFDTKMRNCEKTMGNVLEEFIHHVAQKDDIEFVSINKIFNERM